MDFMLMDSAGNALAAFETRPEAIKAFQMLLGDDPTAKDEVALLAFNRLGFAVGEPLVAADVSPDTAVEVAITERSGAASTAPPSHLGQPTQSAPCRCSGTRRSRLFLGSRREGEIRQSSWPSPFRVSRHSYRLSGWSGCGPMLMPTGKVTGVPRLSPGGRPTSNPISITIGTSPSVPAAITGSPSESTRLEPHLTLLHSRPVPGNLDQDAHRALQSAPAAYAQLPPDGIELALGCLVLCSQHHCSPS